MKWDTSVNYIRILKVQFQGGFSAKQIDLVADADTLVATVYPQDSNAMQSFAIDKDVSSTELTLKLVSPADFYGRFVIYHLDLVGSYQL